MVHADWPARNEAAPGIEPHHDGVLSAEEVDRLEAACRAIPLEEREHVPEDMLTELFVTVLDYQNRAETVRKSMEHFRSEHADVRSFADLEIVLADHPDDGDLAATLWGNRHWRRARELRGLVGYFRERDVTDLTALRGWAVGSTQEEFVGRIKGLGPAVYRSLVMRLGVDTIKPDVHVLRFVSGAIGRRVTQDEAVDALETVAPRLGTSARTLDAGVWSLQARGSRPAG
jgi:hypothetical protein